MQHRQGSTEIEAEPKSLPITQMIATSPSSYAEMEFNNHALDGQILHAPCIAAVAMHGLVAATWAHGFSRSLCIDNPSLTAEFGVYDPDAGTGLPSGLDFHRRPDRGSCPPRQASHFTSTEIATEPISCSETGCF